MRKCVAVVALALSLAIVSSPLASPDVPEVNYSQDDRCIANAIFHEARGEPLAGKRAILDVIHNRMASTGKTACQVIKAPKQFSWVGKKPMKRLDEDLKGLLTEVNNSRKILINENMQNFYSGPKPSWARKMFCRKIFNHTFCAEHR